MPVRKKIAKKNISKVFVAASGNVDLVLWIHLFYAVSDNAMWVLIKAATEAFDDMKSFIERF